MLQSQVGLEQQMLELSRDERARIALCLLDSLEQETSSVSQNAIENKWIEESVRRLETYKQGDMNSYSVEDVIADLER